MNAGRRAYVARVALVLLVAAAVGRVWAQSESRTLTWSPVAGAARYIVFIGGGVGTYERRAEPTPPDATSWSIPADALGRVQYFRVMAVDANGQYSDLSEEISTTPPPPPNADPIPANDTATTLEDTPVVVDVAANDTDPDGDSLEVTSVTDPANGTVAMNPAGNTVIYTPDSNFSGTDTFSYTVEDGHLGMAFGSVTVTVTAVNDAPAATNLSVTVSEDVAGPIALIATDAEGDTLTYRVVTPPTHGSLSGTAPNLTYTPAPNYDGPDGFTFKANDGALDSGLGSVTIDVLPANDAPTADDASATTTEDNSVAVTLSGADVEEDSLSFVIASGPVHGTVTIAGNQATYAPNANFNGSDSFTFTANDGAALSAPATISLTVTAVNDLPTAAAGSATTNEDTLVTVTLSAADVDDDTLSYASVSGPEHGTLTISGNQATYTPASNFNGSDSFTFKANDSTGDSNTATIALSISAVNDIPTAADGSATLNEDGSATVTLSGADVDGDSVSYVAASGPSHGTLSISGSQALYTPGANYNGSDSFTFKANDGTADSSAATVSLTITAVNDEPTATDSAATTDEDTVVTVTLSGADVDGDSVTYVSVSGPAHGGVMISGNQATYTPASNFNGSDSFTFKVNDGSSESSVATVAVTVAPVNDAPTAASATATTDEDAPVTVGLSGADADGDTVSFVVASGPAHGTVSISGSQAVYAPAANYFGSDSFTFKANDGSADSTAATVSISIAAVNDQPTAANASATLNEDGSATVTLSGADVDGDSLTFAAASNPAHGTVTIAGNEATYTPAPNFNGSDSFTFTANDAGSASGAATVSLSISAVNDTPTAANGSASLDEDGSATIALAGADIDGDSLTFAAVSGPAHGTLTISGSQALYTPAPNFSGSDSFTFKANDNTADSSAATVSITINGVNDAPVADGQSVTTDEDTAKAILLTASDIDSAELSFSVGLEALHGTVTIAGNTAHYVPQANFVGRDVFHVRASDGLLSHAAAIEIEVTPVNDAPGASDGSFTTNEDIAIATPLTATDVDSDGLNFTIVTPPAHGSVVGGTPQALVYRPDANYFGDDSFTFRVNDGEANSNEATVSLTIRPVNDAPTAADASASTQEDTAATLTLGGADADGDQLGFVMVSGPAHGTLTISGNQATYTPAENYVGADSFTFAANDGEGDSNVATVSITVAEVNDAPVAAAQSVRTDEDSAAAITLGGTDVDNAALTFHVVQAPAHGTLSGDAPNVTYTPAANFSGSDSFTFEARDGGSVSSAATVSLTIAGVNDAPTAADGSATTNEDSSATVALSGADVDGDALTFAVVSGPAHGTLAIAGNDAVYTPNANYFGADSFTFRASDGTLASNVGSVAISIDAVNDAPAATADAYSTGEGVALNVPAPGVVGNDSDLDGDALTAAVESNPAHGALTLNPNGSFTYAPNASFTGLDTFSYRARDGAAVSAAPATVTITVIASNTAPVAQNDGYSLDEDTPLTVAAPGVLGNDADLEHDALTASRISGPAHGSLTLNANGSFIYTPAAGFNGTDSFTYQVSDGRVVSNVATVALAIRSVNDSPIAVNDSASVMINSTATSIAVLANDSTFEAGETLKIVAATQGTRGLVTVASGGTGLTYKPNTGVLGADTFTYTIDDGNGGRATATVNVTILAIPTLTIANMSQPEGDGGLIDAPFVVTLSHAVVVPVMVNYQTTDGFAQASKNDYLATSGTLTFAPGETVKTIIIKIVGDTATEKNETFAVRLSSPFNATLARTDGYGTIQDDDGTNVANNSGPGNSHDDRLDADDNDGRGGNSGRGSSDRDSLDRGKSIGGSDRDSSGSDSLGKGVSGSGSSSRPRSSGSRNRSIFMGSPAYF